MDTLFFITAKGLSPIVRVESWVLLLLLLAAIAFQRGKFGLGQVYLYSSIATYVVLGIFPIGELLLLPLEGRFPTRPHVEAPVGIIVLGGAEDYRRTQATGLPELNEAAERFLTGIALAKAYPDSSILFSGGSGAILSSDASNARVPAQIFAEGGISASRLLLENTSRNTAENAVLALRLDLPSGGPWLLVTSAFHMPRALGAFCAAGWTNLVPYPVDFRGTGAIAIEWAPAEHIVSFNLAAKEWIGLLVYRLTGRTDSFLSEGC